MGSHDDESTKQLVGDMQADAFMVNRILSHETQTYLSVSLIYVLAVLHLNRP